MLKPKDKKCKKKHLNKIMSDNAEKQKDSTCSIKNLKKNFGRFIKK